ncbi:nucleotidyltransferase domain-containing protein [Tolypothrix campylonemoides VB511288]|nr:nucleotidyltransferase domain-containing protein [Tolypothrix campylonemoides VB511288]
MTADELNHFLDSLVQEIDSPAIRGIFLTGSYARGCADYWSDLDLVCLTHDDIQIEDTLLYRDCKECNPEEHRILVSVTYCPLKHWLWVIELPESAIHAIPAFRNMRPLLDKDGVVAQLQETARLFDYASLQNKANRYAAETVFHLVEDVHKLLGGLTKRDESRVLAATHEILQGMTKAVAVSRGVMVESANTYFAQVMQETGIESAWTLAFRQAAGLEPGDVWIRGESALQLFWETTVLLSAHFKLHERDTVDEVIKRIQIGFIPSCSQRANL